MIDFEFVLLLDIYGNVSLEDIICFGNTFEVALENLSIVITKLVEAGLKLRPSKCCLFQDKVQFLGHLVGYDGSGSN